MRIGILTGGGDVPGLNPCIKAVVERAVDEGHEVVGIRRGWWGLLNLNPADPTTYEECFMKLDKTGGAHDRPHRRHLPPHQPHQSEQDQAQGSAGLPARPGTSRARERCAGLHPARAQEPGIPGHRPPDPHRRRRHPQLWRAAASRELPRHRHPQDDGQRRLRHGLLPGLRHRRDAFACSSSTNCAPAPAPTSASPSSSSSGATAARRASSARTWPASTAPSSPRCPSTWRSWPRSS